MSNIIDYKDGLDVNGALFEDDFQSNLLHNGTGRAYGLEILAKKTTGKFTGWLSYSLSKSERKIEGINNGNWYNATNDKTHNVSIVGSYEFTPSWAFSGAFVYSTGNAVTYPVAKYEIDGQTMLEYGARNSNRMPAYHRLDLSVTHEFKNTGKFKKSLIIGAYNVYGRANPYTIDFKTEENNPGVVKAQQSVLFRFVPSIGFDFKF
jgi:predicted porin